MSKPRDDVLAQARQLIQDGQQEEAIEVLDEWLDAHGDDPGAWAALGAAYFDLEDYPQAAKAARQAAQLRPDSPRNWCNLGTVLRKLGRLQDARRAQQRAVGLDPGYRRAHVELGKLRAAAREGEPGPPSPHARRCPQCGASVYATDDFCVECGYDFRAGKPSDQASDERRLTFLRWAVDKAEERRQLQKAEQHLRELLQYRPEDWSLGRRLARLQERRGAYEEALGTWQQLVRTHESSEARASYVDCALTIARMQEKRHQFDAAERTCRQAIEVAGDQETIHERIEEIREAEARYQAEEEAHARSRQHRTQVATTASGFGLVTGALTMIAGILLIMLSIAMVPCCIGIFLLPVAFGVFMSGVGLMVGAPVGGAAVWTLGELPRAMKRFGEYWDSLPPPARQRATVGIAIAIGALIVLGWLLSMFAPLFSEGAERDDPYSRAPASFLSAHRTLAPVMVGRSSSLEEETIPRVQIANRTRREQNTQWPLVPRGPSALAQTRRGCFDPDAPQPTDEPLPRFPGLPPIPS